MPNRQFNPPEKATTNGQPKEERAVSIVLSAFSSVLQEPPSKNTAQFLIDRGWQVTILQRPQRRYIGTPLKGPHRFIETIAAPGNDRRLFRIIEMAAFAAKLNALHWRIKPDVSISMMLYPLGFAVERIARLSKVQVCSVFDIPVIGVSGRATEKIYRRAYRRLPSLDVVWASDECKAALIKERVGLAAVPHICHNAPPANYISEPLWPRDPWLRAEVGRQLRRDVLKECLLVRAGALGEHGGIEETLCAMSSESANIIFVLVGQISPIYRRALEARAASLGVSSRLVIISSPSDDVWKLALRGADIGHMVHLPPPDGYHHACYALNSSLSNNRLFQYMAAGLPVIMFDDPRLRRFAASTRCFEVIRANRVIADLGDALRRLAGSAERRNELGLTGRRAHETKFNWEKQFTPIYEHICERLRF